MYLDAKTCATSARVTVESSLSKKSSAVSSESREVILDGLAFGSSAEFRVEPSGGKFSLDLEGLDPPALVRGVFIPEATLMPLNKLEEEEDRSMDDLSIGVVSIGVVEEGNNVVESRRSNRLETADGGVDDNNLLAFVGKTSGDFTGRVDEVTGSGREREGVGALGGTSCCN